jgi:hypothetical protein
VKITVVVLSKRGENICQRLWTHWKPQPPKGRKFGVIKSSKQAIEKDPKKLHDKTSTRPLLQDTQHQSQSRKTVTVIQHSTLHLFLKEPYTPQRKNSIK